MNILALDYGTKTGYCLGDINEDFYQYAGTWTLASKKEITAWGKQRLNRRCDPRISRLADAIKGTKQLDYVVFEDVEFASSTYQVQLWSSLRAAGWLSGGIGTKFECVPVGTLKKFATGSGSANKEQMRKSLVATARLEPISALTLDDNAVDAIWIWLWAKQTLARA